MPSGDGASIPPSVKWVAGIDLPSWSALKSGEDMISMAIIIIYTTLMASQSPSRLWLDF